VGADGRRGISVDHAFNDESQEWLLGPTYSIVNVTDASIRKL